MSLPAIELIYDHDCPNVNETRRVLACACNQAKVNPVWQEWERSDPSAPAYVRAFGSPTVLIDRIDVEGAGNGTGSNCCRIYKDGASYRKTPTVSMIVGSLTADCEVRSQDCRTKDLITGRVGLLLWGVPTILFILGIGWADARTWLWVPSLAIAGSACLVNANRCARLHCFLTGPIFLLAALFSALNGIGLIAFNWRLIPIIVISGIILGYAFEAARGKYVKSG